MTNSLNTDYSEYFVYHAGGGATGREFPSLTQLPHPRPSLLLQDHVAIVRYCRNRRRRTGDDHHGCCSDCNDYTIASLYGPVAGGPPGTYYFSLFRSDTMAWTREIVPDKDVPNSRHLTSKTIAIGGERGTVGWVHLLQGIILCDVLAATDDTTQRTLRYVPLPSLLREKNLSCPAADIAVVNGFISYIELGVRVVPGSWSRYSAYTADGWVTAKWTMKITDSLSEPWRLDCQLDSSEISDALPKLQVDADTPQPILQTLHIGHPTLSLEDNRVVYFLAKIDHRDTEHTAWVIAVDTVKKTIQGVAGFGAERTLGLAPVYIANLNV